MLKECSRTVSESFRLTNSSRYFGKRRLTQNNEYEESQNSNFKNKKPLIKCKFKKLKLLATKEVRNRKVIGHILYSKIKF